MRHILVATAAMACLLLSVPMLAGCADRAGKAHAEESGTLYTCPMHPEVVEPTPADCPICGMDLVEMPRTEYTCPMHPEIVQDEPGDCPICGMDLVADEQVGVVEEEGPKDWFCPRHPGRWYSHDQRCEVCGLSLAHRSSEPVVAAVETDTETEPEEEAVAEPAVGNAVDDQGRYLCPVMDGPISDIEATRPVTYKGKVYYFCCAGCPEQFEEDPEKFIATIESGE
ncbi:MAG: YHS domain-containing protein [Armatimonadia bacterium]|nr:YHS domain-containing protein [Armatimonadia bacterium]